MALIDGGKPQVERSKLLAYSGIGKGAISKKSMRNSCSERGTVQKVTLLTPGTGSAFEKERGVCIAYPATDEKLQKAAAKISDNIAEWWQRQKGISTC